MWVSRLLLSSDVGALANLSLIVIDRVVIYLSCLMWATSGIDKPLITPYPVMPLIQS